MTPQRFEVVVRGRMSPELISALEGFAVDTDDEGLTRVVGDISDQPHLLGLLGAFADLHIEVVSVNQVDPSTPKHAPAPTATPRPAAPEEGE